MLSTPLPGTTPRIANWYAAWTDRPERVSHVAVMPMPNVDDVRRHVLAQDAVFVDGGSVAGLMVLWRLHGLDAVFQEAQNRRGDCNCRGFSIVEQSV